MKMTGHSWRKVRRSLLPRRSRSSRTRLSWKHSLLFAVALGGSFMLTVGKENRAAIADVVRDPLSILALRSPGQRPAGALFQTKPAYRHLAAASPPFAPVERVLPAVRTRPPAFIGVDSLDLGPLVPIIDEPPFLVPETFRIPGGIPVFDVPGPRPSIEGVPIDEPGTGGEEPPPPPPAPVPEPMTWLTMILGFLAIGTAQRRRRASQALNAGMEPHASI